MRLLIKILSLLLLIAIVNYLGFFDIKHITIDNKLKLEKPIFYKSKILSREASLRDTIKRSLNIKMKNKEYMLTIAFISQLNRKKSLTYILAKDVNTTTYRLSLYSNIFGFKSKKIDKNKLLKLDLNKCYIVKSDEIDTLYKYPYEITFKSGDKKIINQLCGKSKKEFLKNRYIHSQMQRR